MPTNLYEPRAYIWDFTVLHYHYDHKRAFAKCASIFALSPRPMSMEAAKGKESKQRSFFDISKDLLAHAHNKGLVLDKNLSFMHVFLLPLSHNF